MPGPPFLTTPPPWSRKSVRPLASPDRGYAPYYECQAAGQNDTCGLVSGWWLQGRYGLSGGGCEPDLAGEWSGGLGRDLGPGSVALIRLLTGAQDEHDGGIDGEDVRV